MVADARRYVEWETPFLNPLTTVRDDVRRALIILNQHFSLPLLETLWKTCSWRCCADGGANRLYDLLGEAGDGELLRNLYTPDLIKGDLDSLRRDVREYYSTKGVPVLQDLDQDTTDLMKCIKSLEENERKEGYESSDQYETLILGGFSGRLDQTIHLLSYIHKIRNMRSKVYVITDDNIGWVLDEGHHRISIDHEVLGPTCGLLPVGVDSTVLSTSGLRWNLSGTESSFDGLLSTSNHLVSTEPFVTIETSRPIWWCAELRRKI
ncbi:thiamine pyrophosphokinase [Boletus edulis]|nr:thiamine pyrophosphokinase [Boletus edulis]